MVPSTLTRDPSQSGRGVLTQPASLTRSGRPNGHHKLAGFVARVALSVLMGASLSLGLVPDSAQARRSTPQDTELSSPSGLAVAPLSSLPRQARDVYERIHQGGPFRYDKDGTVFFNRERALPRQPRGFYREYTVPTPGSRDRGARRIVCGGHELRQPETCFYTEDHYQSFLTIDPRR